MVILLLVSAFPAGAASLQAVPTSEIQVGESQAASPGDRIRMRIEPSELMTQIQAAEVPVGADYHIGAGDELSIYVSGKGNLKYYVGQPKEGGGNPEGPDVQRVKVALTGEILLPLIGSVRAAGLTTGELAAAILEKLAEFFRDPKVSVAVAQPRTMKVWVSGDVENPGPQVLPGTATVLEALLKAGITPTGSTRRIQLLRSGEAKTIDVYAIVMNGALEQNLPLEPGDTIFVPVAKGFVEMQGEVMRAGKFEPVSLCGGTCCVKDAVDLARGLTSAAVPTRAILERKDPNGNINTIRLDLEKICRTPDCAENIALQDGDRIRVPSISEYQMVVRMVGEFTGDGVYQRMIGEGEEQVLNKSGVYRLAEGETAGDVIRKTGGWTPQADLKNARIERQTPEGYKKLPLDLDRVLVQKDSSADIVLQNGDTLVLPALGDKVQVIGQVTNPGAIAYTPGRRVLDYIGEAGGPTPRANTSNVAIIRNTPQGGRLSRVNIKRGAVSERNNPVLEPGDVVVVPEKVIADWRDILQLLTSYRIIQTIF